MEKYIGVLEDAVRSLEDQEFRIAQIETLIAESRSALAVLENIKAVTAKHFSGRADREIRSMIEAQEFVKLRSAFLGSPVKLIVAAIVDILDLNERGIDKPSPNEEGSIGKALQRFKAKAGYKDYMNAMGELLRDWTLRLPSQEPDKTAP